MSSNMASSKAHVNRDQSGEFQGDRIIRYPYIRARTREIQLRAQWIRLFVCLQYAFHSSIYFSLISSCNKLYAIKLQ